MGVARLAHAAGYYESAIIQSYYAMYNLVQSLFFMCGIKCENHTAAGLVLNRLFQLEHLNAQLKKAKNERISKQYYIATQKTASLCKEPSERLMKSAARFKQEISAYKNQLTVAQLGNIRKKFKKL